MQQYADIYSLQNYSTCFGCHSTHHQEYQKLYPQPPVQVILLVPLLPSYVVWSGLVVRVEYVFLLWPVLLLCVLKKFWFQLAEDDEIIAPKHLGVM